MTFRQCAEEWMGLKKPTWSPATYSDYLYRFTRLIFDREHDGSKVGISDLLLQDVRPVEVERLHGSLSKAPRDQTYVVTLIKAAFNFAVRAKHLSAAHHNPASGAVLPRNKDAEAKEQRVLTAPEIVKLGQVLAEMEAASEVSPARPPRRR